MKKVLVGVVLMSALITLSGCSLFKKTGSDQTTNGAAALEIVPAQGATVSVNYVGKLTDGTVFDTNIEEEAKKAGSGVYSAQREYTPLTFTVGQGQMIPGFEDAVVGMKKGETKTVTIKADKAYGEPKPELLFTTGSSLFEQAGIKPVLGESYNFGGAAGKVVSLSGDKVTLDFNHQLAGKDLQFTITLLDVNATAGISPEPTTTQAE